MAQTLVGMFAGLIGVITVAAIFITAEYRRGLIRLTLTARPRRTRVLAAKAVVIGAVTFAVGLPAAFTALGNRGADDAPAHLALYAGWTKARTLPSTGWLLLAAVEPR